MIARISRGTNMDQIYLPKNRHSFPVGCHVLVKPLDTSSRASTVMKPVLYGIKYVEPVKMSVVESVFECVEKHVGVYENILIAGSFVERGFHFHDVDILLLTEEKVDELALQRSVERVTGIKTHLIVLTVKTLVQGLSTDPLYQCMTSMCIARKRFLYKTKKRVLYKMLDLHLLKSDLMLEHFDALSGDEKYDLTRNMIAIHLFLREKRVNSDMVHAEIQKVFALREISEIRENLLEKKIFLKQYKKIYTDTFNKLMEGVRHDSKQKQAS